MFQHVTRHAYAAIAQLDRVTDYESVGRGFESLSPYLQNTRILRESGYFSNFSIHFEMTIFSFGAFLAHNLKKSALSDGFKAVFFHACFRLKRVSARH